MLSYSGHRGDFIDLPCNLFYGHEIFSSRNAMLSFK